MKSDVRLARRNLLCVYLLHHLVIRFIHKTFGSPNMSALHALALGAVMFAVALVAARVLYLIVEQPMMRVLAPQRRSGAAPPSTAIASTRAGRTGAGSTPAVCSTVTNRSRCRWCPMGWFRR